MRRNRLLASLSASDLDLLTPKLERVEIKARQVLQHANLAMDYVYFPATALITVSTKAVADGWVEVWFVGSEGMIGLPIVLRSSRHTPFRRAALVGGTAFRMKPSELTRALSASQSLTTVLSQYAASVLVEASQSGACNAQHTLKQRLARWLLLARSKLQSDRLPLTHSVLSRLLGVRRPSVTHCLGVIQEEGCLSMSRGIIKITDPERLEAISCSCHSRIMNVYEHLWPNLEQRPTAAIRNQLQAQ